MYLKLDPRLRSSDQEYEEPQEPVGSGVEPSVTLLTKVIFRRLTTAKDLLELIELSDLLLRVSRQFKMALTYLQTAIKSLRGMLANLMFQTLADPSDIVTVDDRGVVTVDDKDLESILGHATIAWSRRVCCIKFQWTKMIAE
jgi:hypothetical protein